MKYLLDFTVINIKLPLYIANITGRTLAKYITKTKVVNGKVYQTFS